MDEHEIEDIRKQRKPEIDLLHRMAEAVKASKELPAGQEVSGSLAMIGQAYLPERALMVVGQSPNGAMAGEWLRSDLDERFIDSVVRAFFGPSPNGHPCPMRWVTDQWSKELAEQVWARKGWQSTPYSTDRSAFWRTLKDVVANLNVANTGDDAWPSHLVWTNLYKINPADRGNPGRLLCAPQFDCCVELLKAEIESYRPRRILFSTGLDWPKPFLRDLGFVPEKVHSTHGLGVKDIGTLRDISYSVPRVVVASHPQARGTDEGAWVRQVVEAFGAH